MICEKMRVSGDLSVLKKVLNGVAEKRAPVRFGLAAILGVMLFTEILVAVALWLAALVATVHAATVLTTLSVTDRILAVER